MQTPRNLLKKQQLPKLAPNSGHYTKLTQIRWQVLGCAWAVQPKHGVSSARTAKSIRLCPERNRTMKLIQTAKKESQEHRDAVKGSVCGKCLKHYHIIPHNVFSQISNDCDACIFFVQCKTSRRPRTLVPKFWVKIYMELCANRTGTLLAFGCFSCFMPTQTPLCLYLWDTVELKIRAGTCKMKSVNYTTLDQQSMPGTFEVGNNITYCE